MDHTKINLVVRLQHLDNQIESIESLQRGLPEEIEALEEDIAFTSRQIESRAKVAEEQQTMLKKLTETVENSREKIKGFKEKQTLARNNKEYDALSKQIEYEEKEIAQAEIKLQDIAQKEEKTKEMQDQGRQLIAENRYDEISENMMPDDVLSQQLKDLRTQVKQKKEELESIVVETSAEVSSLKKQISEQRAVVEKDAKRLLSKYDHLKNGNVQNAIVKLHRQACSGCNTRVPTNRHTIIVQGGFYLCESCGRIVVHERLFEEAATMS